MGTYKDQFGVLNYTIAEYEGQLVTLISPTIPAFLSYKEDGAFQITLPPSLPCVTYEVTAANNQWMYFDEVDTTGKSPGFLFPGLYGLDKFHRT